VHVKRRNGKPAILSQEDARLWQADKIAQKQKREDSDIALHQEVEEYVAFVDWGRWILLCHCGAGVAVHPDWTEHYCFGCGAIFLNVTFPAERLDVEAALLVRHKNNRFFFPQKGETLETLVEENTEHGLVEK
jgi:hypothetical protein